MRRTLVAVNASADLNVQLSPGGATRHGRCRVQACQRRSCPSASYIPAILIPETEVAFQILALNTEKAHNLKEESVEVARMYAALLGQDGTRRENEYSFELEQAHFITLGFVYAERSRFPGSAFTLDRVP